jgi:hypothetical protein
LIFITFSISYQGLSFTVFSEFGMNKVPAVEWLFCFGAWGRTTGWDVENIFQSIHHIGANVS